tara:strand:- start:974 stop:1279 length:306 start_codon:yes stop_codon:yes gene_type:complete
MSKTGAWNLDIVENGQKPFKKNSKFQKRHYEHIARSIKGLAIAHENNEAIDGYETVSVPLIVSALCSSFKKDNPNFSVETFVEALALTEDCRKKIIKLVDV